MLNQIKEGSTIYAAELLTHRGKREVTAFYEEHWDDLQKVMGAGKSMLLNFKPKRAQETEHEEETRIEAMLSQREEQKVEEEIVIH